MKKIFRPLFAVMAIALVASCTEQMENDNVPDADNLVQMTFSATMEGDVESKTTLDSSTGIVLWEASDAITVFSIGESVTATSFADPELLEDNAVARFSGVADASAETYYAVYPHSEANTYADGTFTVNFPAEQTAVANGFASGSNVSVAVSVKDADVTEQNIQFKNVGALLAFSFMDLETALNTASVTFKAKKNDAEYCGLAGTTTFTLDEDNLPVAAEGDRQAVVVNAPEGGFNTGVTYFIPVIPVGACTGMEVVYTDLNGDTYTKRNDVDFELLRSYMFNAGQLRNPYDIELSEDFVVEFNFAEGWPFREPCKYVSKSGETYTYVYEFEDNGKTRRVPWSLKLGNKDYEMTETGLSNTAENSFMMQLPAVSQRYLTRLKVSLASDSKNARPALQTKWQLVGAGEYCLMGSGYIKKGTECVMDFYSDKIVFTGTFCSKQTSTVVAREYSFSTESTYNRFTPTPGLQYWYKLREPAIISKLTLRYSATAPGNAPTEAAE